MARQRRKPVEVEVDEEEDVEETIDEELEDLEDLADEDDEVEDDEDEDDDEEEAPRRRKKKTTAKKASAKPEKDTVGSKDLAEALGTDGKNLRVMLRARNVKKNETGRYEWDSVDDALEAL